MDFTYFSVDVLQRLFLSYTNNLEILEQQIAKAGGDSEAKVGLVTLRNDTQNILYDIAKRLTELGITPLSEEHLYHDLLIRAFNNKRGMPRYPDKIQLDRARDRFRISSDRAIALEQEVRQRLAIESFADIEVEMIDVLRRPVWAGGRPSLDSPMAQAALLLGCAIRLSVDVAAQAFLSNMEEDAFVDVHRLSLVLLSVNNVSTFSGDVDLFEYFLQLVAKDAKEPPPDYNPDQLVFL